MERGAWLVEWVSDWMSMYVLGASIGFSMLPSASRPTPVGCWTLRSWESRVQGEQRMKSSRCDHSYERVMPS